MAKISRYNLLTQIPTAIVLMLSQSIVSQALAADRLQERAPIRLPLTFVRSNAITTISVGGKTIQAGVDTGGGPITLSRDVIDSAGGVRVPGTNVGTDSFGQSLIEPRFRVPVVSIGGETFKNMAVVEAPTWPAGKGPPVPNWIGRQFLSRYFVVLDFPHRSITLWPPGSKSSRSADCGRVWIPMVQTEQRGLAVSDFETSSGRARLLFDSGATYSAFPKALADRLRVPTIARGPMRFWQVSALSAAGHDFGPVEFVLMPFQLPRDFQGMLGRNFFAHHVVCLDYRLRKVFIR